MNEQTAAKRWWAQAILIGGVIAAACLPLGALGTKIGLWAFTGGFMFLAAGAVLAALASFLGVIAYIISLRKNLVAERPTVLIGIFLGVVVLVCCVLKCSICICLFETFWRVSLKYRMYVCGFWIL